MEFFGDAWDVSEVIQAVSAVLSFFTLLVISLSLTVTRSQIKQSVRPLLVPEEHDFTLYSSPKIDGYFTAHPYIVNKINDMDTQRLSLSIPIKNLGIGPATSVVAEWKKTSRSFIKSELEKLCHDKAVDIELHDYGFEIRHGESYRALYTLRDRRNTFHHIPAMSNSHVLEDVVLQVPNEVIFLMFSYFEKELKADNVVAMDRGDLRFKMRIRCKDVSGRKIVRKYLVYPKLTHARIGAEECVYQGQLQVEPLRFLSW